MENATEFAVVRFADGWRVLTHDSQMGKFRYRVDAEEAALRLAAKARDQGKAVTLLVQETNGEMRPLDIPGAAAAPR